MDPKISYKDRIFVAGARGMVGSAICRNLIKRGYGNNKRGGQLLAPNREQLNLQDKKEVEEWFKDNKPSVTILAAAKVGGILANKTYPKNFLLDNLQIQNNVIEASWKFGVRRLLFLGSSCIYPKFCDQPIKEEYLLSGNLEKTNECYAIAKIAGIKLCQALREQYNYDAISLMPTNLYGPGDNYHPSDSHVMAALISKFYKAKKENQKSVLCWGTGNPLREFLHVDDLGNAAVFCLEKWDPNDINAPKDSLGKELSYLNVGTGKDISIFQLAKKISTTIDFRGEIIWDKSKPDGTPKKQLDISQISKLGWNPKIDLDVGILNTINDYSNKIKTYEEKI